MAHVIERRIQHAIGSFELGATACGLEHDVAEDGDGAGHIADLIGIIERRERGDGIGMGEAEHGDGDLAEPAQGAIDQGHAKKANQPGEHATEAEIEQKRLDAPLLGLVLRGEFGQACRLPRLARCLGLIYQGLKAFARRWGWGDDGLLAAGRQLRHGGG